MKPHLRAGRVYRTKDLSKWAANPTRLAKRLVQKGVLRQLGNGLFVRPEQSKFGPTPPSERALMRGFLKRSPFVFTGPEKWNALGLGTTALFATPLVYNTKRSGTFKLGERSYKLRRMKFPRQPPPEWYVVDLLENREQAGTSEDVLRESLRSALRANRFDREKLKSAAHEYGTHKTQSLVEEALQASAA